ncbi:MAG: DMT family transporter [Clostridia bacterium]|nr:DMT family transporter [Clostridia bacterium]
MFNIPAAGIEIAIKGINMDHFSWMTVIGVLWLGTICTAGSNLWWNQALERLPAAICSLFYPVMPFTTAVLGIVLLDEKITFIFLAGAVLVVTGMLYTIIGEMRDNKKEL